VGRAHIGGGSGVGLGVIAVWLCGHFGLDLTAEIGATIGGLTLGAGQVIYRKGIMGVARTLMFGERQPEKDADGEQKSAGGE
jgi:hypothetical protein